MMNPKEIANIDRTERDLWWYRGMREITFALVDRAAPGWKPETILEAGAGTGYFAAILAERMGGQVTALDLDEMGARLCGQRKGVKAVRGSMERLPFPDGHFDLTASMDVLVHFAEGEEKRPFEELVRVTRPGGLLLIRVSAFRILRSRHSQFAWERQRFTPARLARLAEEAGVEIVSLTCANTLLSPVALFKFRIWEPLLRTPPASGVTPLPWPLEPLFYRALALEARLLGNGMRFPFGQSLFLIGRKRESVRMAQES